MIEDVPLIFGAVFQCTLKMITKNFEDHPEHRLKFFSLLRAIAAHCFPALIGLSSQQIKLVMDSIIWAFRHTEQNIAETGLNLLLAILKNFQERFLGMPLRETLLRFYISICYYLLGSSRSK
ncbi:protein EXPORTIN 1A-like isoform X2 [Punica granatum]|uniref:Protein EXPORTIN 1A-like isoform X2 n=1 Tax=Punica granatum TaxID=22663 RepID=A0A6P8C5L5_PUNGR|nr:protein EXPORTIN 1A-like isoform X2 [Punica granatum]